MGYTGVHITPEQAVGLLPPVKRGSSFKLDRNHAQSIGLPEHEWFLPLQLNPADPNLSGLSSMPAPPCTPEVHHFAAQPSKSDSAQSTSNSGLSFGNCHHQQEYMVPLNDVLTAINSGSILPAEYILYALPPSRPACPASHDLVTSPYAPHFTCLLQEACAML